MELLVNSIEELDIGANFPTQSKGSALENPAKRKAEIATPTDSASLFPIFPDDASRCTKKQRTDNDAIEPEFTACAEEPVKREVTDATDPSSGSSPPIPVTLAPPLSRITRHQGPLRAAVPAVTMHLVSEWKPRGSSVGTQHHHPPGLLPNTQRLAPIYSNTNDASAACHVRLTESYVPMERHPHGGGFYYLYPSLAARPTSNNASGIERIASPAERVLAANRQVRLRGLTALTPSILLQRAPSAFTRPNRSGAAGIERDAGERCESSTNNFNTSEGASSEAASARRLSFDLTNRTHSRFAKTIVMNTSSIRRTATTGSERPVNTNADADANSIERRWNANVAPRNDDALLSLRHTFLYGTDQAMQQKQQDYHRALCSQVQRDFKDTCERYLRRQVANNNNNHSSPEMTRQPRPLMEPPTLDLREALRESQAEAKFLEHQQQLQIEVNRNNEFLPASRITSPPLSPLKNNNAPTRSPLKSNNTTARSHGMFTNYDERDFASDGRLVPLTRKARLLDDNRAEPVRAIPMAPKKQSPATNRFTKESASAFPRATRKLTYDDAHYQALAEDESPVPLTPTLPEPDPSEHDNEAACTLAFFLAKSNQAML